jgi:hypothetical protein
VNIFRNVLGLSLAAVLAVGFTDLRAQDAKRTAARTILAGKSIEFYINHKRIDRAAKEYYEGKWKVADNDRTFAMLDSVMTRNAETRPFYFYLLNKVMKTADGALAEYVGVVCVRYFRQYPCELISREPDAVYEVDRKQWVNFIAFELYLPESFRKYVGELKTSACQGQALTAILNDIEQTIVEENAH